MSRVDEIESDVRFVAYNQAIEDAKAAIRGEKVDDPYAAATFINAIARKCSPHVYVNRLKDGGAEDVIDRNAAMRAVCTRCANPERYGPAQSIEDSERLWHFQIVGGWNTGQCDAVAIIRLPSAATESSERRGKRAEPIDAESQYQVDAIRARRFNNFRGTAEEWVAFEYGSAAPGGAATELAGERRWLTCAKCGQQRDMAGCEDSDFLCRYCFSTEFTPTATPVAQPGAHAFTAESRSLPCDTCGLIYSAPIHHGTAQPPRDDGRVYCRGCSEAGGADRAVYHTPPTCDEVAQPEADPRTRLGDVLGFLHVINSEAVLLVNFTDDPHLRPKERGEKIQEYRLKAHLAVCEIMDTLKLSTASPSTATQEAAKEINSLITAELGRQLDDPLLRRVAAIVSKYRDTDSHSELLNALVRCEEAETALDGSARRIATLNAEVSRLNSEVERLKSERLQIQRALASTVLEDPSEDDEPPYSTIEIVHGITSLEERRRNAVKRAARARADAIGECVEVCVSIESLNRDCASSTSDERSKYAYECYAAGAQQSTTALEQLKGEGGSDAS